MERFEALDAWRGICALFVVLFHYCFIFESPLIRHPLITNAYLLVDFFFVLSGFVVCHAYAQRVGSARAWGLFVLRRIGRLWPLHATILAAFVAFILMVNLLPHPDRFNLTVAPSEYSLVAIPIHLLLLNAANLHGMSWNAPSWSIGAEFHTYLLFGALCVLALGRMRWFALPVALAALGVIAYASPTYMNSTADLGLFRCFAGFFAGVAAYGVHRRLATATLPAATFFEALALALVVGFLIAAGAGPDRVDPLSLAAPAVFALAVLIFARQRGALSALLRTKPFAALGRWSFSIYMTHQLVLMAAAYLAWATLRAAGGPVQNVHLVEGHAKMLYALGGDAGSFAVLVLVLSTVLLLSAFTHARVEQPGQQAFNRMAARLERAAPVRRAYALAAQRPARRASSAS